MTSASPLPQVTTEVVERLTGATGDPDRVVETAWSCAERCLAEIAPELGEAFAAGLGIEVGTVELTRFARSRPKPDGYGAVTIATAETSPDAMLMSIDADGLAVAVCAMFGGDADLSVAPIVRPLTSIELDVAGQLFGIVAAGFNGAGERALGLDLPPPPPMTDAEIEKQVMRDGPAVRVDFVLRFGESSGHLRVTFPQRFMMQHRTVKDTSRSAWRERFSEEVMRSTVTLRATIPMAQLTLGEIASLRVGQILEMPKDGPSRTKLSARDQTLFQCEFGKLGNNYTVRVVQPFDAQQDFVEGLLSA